MDVLSAQSELFPRLDKGLVKDHKIGEQDKEKGLVKVLDSRTTK